MKAYKRAATVKVDVFNVLAYIFEEEMDSYYDEYDFAIEYGREWAD
jgi:hypothetical protein